MTHDSDDPRDTWRSPLTERYASPDMSRVFSARTKFTTWRRLWIALAEAQQALGLEITDEQLEAMRSTADDVDFDRAAELERETRHDVVAHIRTWAEQAPAAAPIIHLGATSAYVGDNTDLVVLRRALRLAAARATAVVESLAAFADEHADRPCLAYTHFQPAQLTTVGKRACLWMQDLLWDIEALERAADELPFLGVKGTTGTQASFLRLFDGDHDKVEDLDVRVTEAMGFQRRQAVSGQTYSRKWDWTVLSACSGLAQSAHKFANDVRLLQNLGEVEEPFGTKQVGSSAMAYKRNPMRSERMTALARLVMNLADNAAQTAAEQWFERTLDDSANRRVSLAESFLAVDAILVLWRNVASGLTVHPDVVLRRVNDELPFMATEDILMEGVKAGGDRQHLHERIREHSMEARARVRRGDGNDLLERLAGDPDFAAVSDRLAGLARPDAYIGRSPQQTRDFLRDHVEPALEARASALADLSEGRLRV